MPRMTITDAARACGVHKSTVSRQARQYGLVSADGLIDLDAYQDLRSGGLDPALQTSGPATARPAASFSDTPSESAAFQAERLRKMTADANKAEMENAARRGELLPRAAIQSTIGTAARQLRERCHELIRDTITDDADRARAADGLDDIFEAFAVENLKNGGAAPR